jgi:hypothetical protein|tara:strand:- start:197 stop:436 length:240 start_codon:yes stop_codon:yes gene_type:complete
VFTALYPLAASVTVLTLYRLALKKNNRDYEGEEYFRKINGLELGDILHVPSRLFRFLTCRDGGRLTVVVETLSKRCPNF